MDHTPKCHCELPVKELNTLGDDLKIIIVNYP